MVEGRTTPFGAKFRAVDLGAYFNWPPKALRGNWWKALAERIRGYPEGNERPWGIPFRMGAGVHRRVILVAEGRPEVTIKLSGKANFICLLHAWHQLPDETKAEDPSEGLVVAEYVLTYSDGATQAQPVRGRFEVTMVESPGPPWLAQSFRMWGAVDPVKHPESMNWGHAQTGVARAGGEPLVYALPNPNPERNLRSLTIRGLQPSPLIVAGLTLYRGVSHPLRHLPRRTYRVHVPGEKAQVEAAEVDLGGVVRLEKTTGPRGKRWLRSQYPGVSWVREPEAGSEKLIEAFGSEDATLSVKLSGRQRPLKFSLGEAFRRGRAPASRGRAEIRTLGKVRQWVKVIVRDSHTREPVPVRIHFSGSRGEYIAPYGHPSQINTNWFEEYGADVAIDGRNYAYVPGEFTTDLPVGDLYVEICKGFEYKPVRRKVTVKPGQKLLELKVDRKLNWRERGWVTADTHVHFISPQTAWLEGQAEGVNVVNLLATQLGRLFTNVGDLTGKVGTVDNDTIVYVGTENRNHMLGHMSMLGTQGPPVYPMCCGGPSESFVGDPDFMTMAEWALENKRKGGVVIRPHFPFCGNTEDPVPILKGLVDALEIGALRGGDFATQEWYRYLNCGCRVAVVGGTDKMGAYCALGWMRTYALLDTDRPFDYDNWADAVRAGRCFSTTGPLIDISVEGRGMSETVQLPRSGGTVEVEAWSESVWPLGKLEIVYNGQVVAAERAPKGASTLRVHTKVKVPGSGWIAARCTTAPDHPARNTSAHTSPVYLKCGNARAFDGVAAQHMLALVEGSIEYMNTLATVFDEKSRKRMVKLFKEAQQELKGRLVVEAGHAHHQGRGEYHTHGHGRPADHEH